MKARKRFRKRRAWQRQYPRRRVRRYDRADLYFNGRPVAELHDIIVGIDGTDGGPYDPADFAGHPTSITIDQFIPAGAFDHLPDEPPQLVRLGDMLDVIEEIGMQVDRFPPEVEDMVGTVQPSTSYGGTEFKPGPT